MASNHLLLSAAVLLSVLAAAVASAGTNCQPGLAIPHNPLQRCRAYVVSRTCNRGPRLPLLVMKQQCCEELESIPAYCRCEALRIIMDGVVTSQGVLEGNVFEDLPGCTRDMQRGFAATLTTPAECNLQTIHGGPYCICLDSLVTAGDVPKY